MGQSESAQQQSTVSQVDSQDQHVSSDVLRYGDCIVLQSLRIGPNKVRHGTLGTYQSPSKQSPVVVIGPVNSSIRDRFEPCVFRVVPPRAASSSATSTGKPLRYGMPLLFENAQTGLCWNNKIRAIPGFGIVGLREPQASGEMTMCFLRPGEWLTQERPSVVGGSVPCGRFVRGGDTGLALKVVDCNRRWPWFNRSIRSAPSQSVLGGYLRCDGKGDRLELTVQRSSPLSALLQSQEEDEEHCEWLVLHYKGGVLRPSDEDMDIPQSFLATFNVVENQTRSAGARSFDFEFGTALEDLPLSDASGGYESACSDEDDEAAEESTPRARDRFLTFDSDSQTGSNDDNPWLGFLAGVSLELTLPLDRLHESGSFQLELPALMPSDHPCVPTSSGGNGLKAQFTPMPDSELPRLPAGLVPAAFEAIEDSTGPWALCAMCAFGVLMGRLARQNDLPLCHNLVNSTSLYMTRIDVSEGCTFRGLVEMQAKILVAQRDWGVPPASMMLSANGEVSVPSVSVLRHLKTDGVKEHLLQDVDAALELRVSKGGAPAIGWFYEPSVLDAKTVERWHVSLITLFNAALTSVDKPASTLDILSSAERHRITVEWNRTEKPYPDDKRIFELIETQAKQTGTTLAVEDSFGTKLTYSDLLQHMMDTSAQLMQMGVVEDTLVVVLLQRHAALVVAVFAILRAAGAYVPVDASYPPERIEYIIEDSCSPIVVTDPTLRSLLGKGNGKQQILEMQELSAGKPFWTSQVFLDMPTADSSTWGTGSPESLAYVIYTSGSTGRPKGVLVPHRGLVNDIWSVYHEFFRAEDVKATLFSTNICFDAHVDELYMPLVVGGRLSMITKITEDPMPEDITFAQTTPSVLSVIDFPQTITALLVGGEAFTEQCWRRVCNIPNVVNGYGPTEITNECCLRRIRGTGEHRFIGGPIPNVQAYVVDEHLAPVPLSVFGELVIGGVGVTRGYLNLPERTARSFPTVSTLGPGRMYRTGDLVRWQIFAGVPDIEYSGRIDSQIKLRGYRIEISEIESVILQENGAEIKSCAVIVREDRPGVRQLVAYVTPENVDVTCINYGPLPIYMKPQVVVAIKDLPLTPNGKLDQRALPAPAVNPVPERTRQQSATPKEKAVQLVTGSIDSNPDSMTGRSFLAQYDADWTLATGNAGAASSERPSLSKTQSTLLELFCDVLGLQSVGLKDSFFVLGGNSLLAFQLRTLVRRHFGVQLEPQTIFQMPTVEALANVLDGSATEQLGPGVILPIQPVGDLEPFFCFHPAGGMAFPYFALAREMDEVMGSDRPFYGVQDPCLTDSSRPLFESLEAMAVEYVKHVQEVQHTGPYFLGGHSTGGALAFEVARLLEEKGEEVRVLILIDSDFEEHADSRRIWHTQLKETYNGWKEGLMHNHAVLMELKYQRRVEEAARRRKRDWGKLVGWRFLKHFLPSGGSSSASNDGPVTRGFTELAEADSATMLRLLKHHMELSLAFHPFGHTQDTVSDLPREKRLKAHVVLIHAIARAEDLRSDPRYGWMHVCHRGSVVQLEGNHYNLLTYPRVQRLARVVCKAIRSQLTHSVAGSLESSLELRASGGGGSLEPRTISKNSGAGGYAGTD